MGTAGYLQKIYDHVTAQDESAEHFTLKRLLVEVGGLPLAMVRPPETAAVSRLMVLLGFVRGRKDLGRGRPEWVFFRPDRDSASASENRPHRLYESLGVLAKLHLRGVAHLSNAESAGWLDGSKSADPMGVYESVEALSVLLNHFSVELGVDVAAQSAGTFTIAPELYEEHGLRMDLGLRPQWVSQTNPELLQLFAITGSPLYVVGGQGEGKTRFCRDLRRVFPDAVVLDEYCGVDDMKSLPSGAIVVADYREVPQGDGGVRTIPLSAAVALLQSHIVAKDLQSPEVVG